MQYIMIAALFIVVGISFFAWLWPSTPRPDPRDAPDGYTAVYDQRRGYHIRHEERVGWYEVEFASSDGQPIELTVSVLFRADPQQEIDLDRMIEGSVSTYTRDAFVSVGSRPAFTAEAIRSGEATGPLLAAVYATIAGPLHSEEGVIILDMSVVGPQAQEG
jgi:hypothetical protein